MHWVAVTICASCNMKVTSCWRRSAALLLLLFAHRLDCCWAHCPPNDDCGPFGSCILDTRSCGDNCQKECKCDPDYTEHDCSYYAQNCPGEVGPNDVQTCFNGGKCYSTTVYKGDATTIKWQCDCTQAYGDAGIFAGHQCEYPAERSCEVGVATSEYAFCVNGGVCAQMVQSGQKFVPCKCPLDFEGRHCQYAAGTAPAQELIYAPPPQPQELSGGAIFGIVIASLAAFGFIIGIALICKRKQSIPPPKETEDSSNNDDNLELYDEPIGDAYDDVKVEII